MKFSSRSLPVSALTNVIVPTPGCIRSICSCTGSMLSVPSATDPLITTVVHVPAARFTSVGSASPTETLCVPPGTAIHLPTVRYSTPCAPVA